MGRKPKAHCGKWWRVTYGALQYPLHSVLVVKEPGAVGVPAGHLVLREDEEGYEGHFERSLLTCDEHGYPVSSYHPTWAEAKAALVSAHEARYGQAQSNAKWWRKRLSRAHALRQESYLEELYDV